MNRPGVYASFRSHRSREFIGLLHDALTAHGQQIARRAAEYANRLPEIRRHIESSPAIGEIGLDFHWVKDASTYPAQRKVLEYFIAAAAEQNKFVNLHTKAGEKEILDLLEKYDVRRAIIHWYSGPMDILRAMIDFGCYFTIGVEVLYSDYIKDIAKAVPDHLLLTETDNPGALPFTIWPS